MSHSLIHTETSSANPAQEPQIVATPGTCGGKPRIAGTRVKVQHVAIWYERMGMSPDEIVSTWPHLTLADVYEGKSPAETLRANDGLNGTLD